MEPSTIFLSIALKTNPDNLKESSLIQNQTLIRSTSDDQSVVIGPVWVNTQGSDNHFTIDFGSNFEQPVALIIDFSKKIDMSKPVRVKITRPEEIENQIKNQDLTNSTAYKFLRYKHEVLFDSISPKLIAKNENTQHFVWYGDETSTPYFKNSIVMRMDTGESASFHISFYHIADINMDGVVNGKDLSIITSSLEGSDEDINGDINGDGVTDSQDLTLFSSYWN